MKIQVGMLSPVTVKKVNYQWIPCMSEPNFFGLSTYMTKGDKNVKLGIKDRTLVLYAVQIIFFKKGI
jgi:hypothetical protein